LPIRLWVRGVMARISLFDGVDATLYTGTKEISDAHDSISDEALLSEFATLLTREQIDKKYNERRKRKEERESGKFSTPAKPLDRNGSGKGAFSSSKMKDSLSLGRVDKGKSSIDNKNEGFASVERKTSEASDRIEERIAKMSFNDAASDEADDYSEVGSEDGSQQKTIADDLNRNTNPGYIFGESDVPSHEIVALSEPVLVSGSYKMKINKAKRQATFTRVKGSAQATSYYKIITTDGAELALAKTK